MMPTSNRRPGPWLHCFALVFMLVPVMAAVANAARPLRGPLWRLAGKVQHAEYAIERRIYASGPVTRPKVVALPVRSLRSVPSPICSRL
jgi:hypothetical protein